MRDGTYDEAELEAQLQNRGLMYRYFGKWMRSIDKEWKLYRSRVFGMGFDTATEVALLASTHYSPPNTCRGTRSCASRFSSPRAWFLWTRSTVSS